jgi:hypothetical protein
MVSVQGLHRHAVVGQRQRHDRRVQFALPQQFQQAHREIFLQHQRHLRNVVDQVPDQRRQQIGADGVDHAQAQGTGQRVLVLLGQFLDGGGLLEHAFGLRHDLGAQRRDRDFRAAALEQDHAQFVFELLDGDRQGRLGHKTGFGGVAKMSGARNGDDVFQLGECHCREVTLELH